VGGAWVEGDEANERRAERARREHLVKYPPPVHVSGAAHVAWQLLQMGVHTDPGAHSICTTSQIPGAQTVPGFKHTASIVGDRYFHLSFAPLSLPLPCSYLSYLSLPLGVGSSSSPE
jgi:hypothetical protein